MAMTLNEADLNKINGGVITITICGVVFVGWKAVSLIAAGVTTIGGATALLGAWNGIGMHVISNFLKVRLF